MGTGHKGLTRGKRLSSREVVETAMNQERKKTLQNTLRKHGSRMKHLSLTQQFAADPDRQRRYAVRADPLRIDYSRNGIDDVGLSLLEDYAQACRLPEKVAQLFSRGKIDAEDHHTALHWAWRTLPSRIDIALHGKSLGPEIAAGLQQLQYWAEALHLGRLRGYSSKPFHHIVHIGIGGSDTGVRLLYDAFRHWRCPDFSVTFLSNIDPKALRRTLADCDPETTLFVLCSKSFTTLETLKNAHSVRQWLQAHARNRGVDGHFLAVTNAPQAAVEFGVPRDQIRFVQDWVGGRYSVWSPVALSVVLAFGFAPFQEFLAGAESMDRHFRDQPLRGNAPALLGLLDVWHRSFCGIGTLACVPYDQGLSWLPEYLAQLMMESNGKGVNRAGGQTWSCAPIVWGGVGSNSQHSFGQFLHQGIDAVAVDFLVGWRAGEAEVDNGREEWERARDVEHHALLFANCLAQAQALMQGREDPEVHKALPGNRPSTLILYEFLNPFTLGNLLALYEHRTFVQAVLWDIDPFDQWGVEQGKHLAKGITHALLGHATPDQCGAAPDACSYEHIALYRHHAKDTRA